MYLTESVQLWLQSRSWSLPFLLSLLFSLAALLGLNFAWESLRINTGVLNFFGEDYNREVQGNAPLDGDVVGLYLRLLSSPAVWLALLLILVLALAPDLVVRVCRKHWAAARAEARLMAKHTKTKLRRGSYELRGLDNRGYDEHDTGVQGRTIAVSSDLAV